MTDTKKQPYPSHHPLYQQVRRMLVDRLASGEWVPGELLPSETALARLYGVSQGTIRKALDTMATERLVVRHQGRGTEVAKHNKERSLFQFWHLYAEDGSRQIPSSQVLDCARTIAEAAEAECLNLAQGAPVIRIRRCRLINDQPTIIEQITVPAERFPGMENFGKSLPNTLYSFYQKDYRVTVQSAVEKLRAVIAERGDAEMLELAPGDALLEIERIALDLEKKPVELRLSRCNTQSLHYRNVLD